MIADCTRRANRRRRRVPRDIPRALYRIPTSRCSVVTDKDREREGARDRRALVLRIRFRPRLTDLERDIPESPGDAFRLAKPVARAVPSAAAGLRAKRYVSYNARDNAPPGARRVNERPRSRSICSLISEFTRTPKFTYI